MHFDMWYGSHFLSARHGSYEENFALSMEATILRILTNGYKVKPYNYLWLYGVQHQLLQHYCITVGD